MSTTGMPQKKERSTATKVVLYGCLILVVGGVLVAVAVGVSGYFLVKRGKGFVRNLEQEGEVARELTQQELELEAALPSRIVADLDQVVLTSEQLDAYLGVCRAIEPELNELVIVEDSLKSLQGVQTEIPNPLKVMGLPLKLMQAQNAAKRALLARLQEEGMAPSDFRSLASLVEWRFLRRPEAMALALDPDNAAELESLRAQIQALEQLEHNPAFDVMGKVMKDSFQDPRENLDELRQRAQELEASAQARVALHPTSQEVLEARRRELEGRERRVETLYTTTHGGVHIQSHSHTMTIEHSQHAEEPEPAEVP